MSLVKTLYPKGLAMCLQFSMYIVLVILLKCDYFAKFTILYLVNLFCLNQDVQDLRMYRMFFFIFIYIFRNCDNFNIPEYKNQILSC